VCTEQNESQPKPILKRIRIDPLGWNWIVGSVKVEEKKPDCFSPNKMAYPLCVGNPKTSEECKTCDFYENLEEGGHEK
jgi:hypothetical protein